MHQTIRMFILPVLAVILVFPDLGATAQAQQRSDIDPRSCAEVPIPYRQAAPRHVPPGLEVIPDCYPRGEGREHGGLEGRGYQVLDPVQSWALTQNPDPRINFDIMAAPLFAGDVNGDGVNDYIYTTFSAGARDERTPELADVTGKTALFFGAETPTQEPDQIVYGRLRFAGDLNGDGYADAIAEEDGYVQIYTGSPSGYQIAGFPLNVAIPGDDQVVGGVDLDGDGYEDAVLFEGGFAPVGEFWVIYGTDDVANAEVRRYTGDPELIPRVINVADLDGSGQSVLVEVSGMPVDWGGEGLTLEVYRFEADRSRTLVQQFPLDMNTGAFDINITFLQMDGTGPLEMLLSTWGDNRVYTWQESGTFSESYVSFGTHGLTPIGDLNGDGRADYYVQGDGVGYVALGPADLAGGPGLDVSIPYPDGGWIMTPRENYYGGYGDLDGDGIDDAVLIYDGFAENGDAVRGRRILFGNSDPAAIDVVDVLYSSERILDRIFSVHSLGDINADGTEDFAMVRLDRREVSVFFGGASISSTPDLTLSAPAGTQSLAETAVGDFNGDGVPDLVATYVSRADVYFGGSDFDATADLTMNLSVRKAENVGDVNGDGFDDLLMSGGAAQSYLFFGGPGFAATPDVTIPHPVRPSTHTALGDFNGDGYGDFAVGFGDFGGLSEIHVYFGGADPSFSGPDLVIEPDAQTGSSYFPFAMTGGDFNGDGYGDLAAVPMDALPPLDVYVNVYYGGPEADATADRYLKIPTYLLSSGYTGPGDSDENGLVNMNSGGLTTVPGVGMDGADALVLTDFYATNALLYGDIAGSDEPTTVLRAANQGAGLGGTYMLGLDPELAVGDFDGDGRLDLIIPQPEDNNDAVNSARVYRYVIEDLVVSTEPSNGSELTEAYMLSAAYPNPLREQATFELTVREGQEMLVEVYDILGRRVQTLFDGPLSAGTTENLMLDASRLPSGTYIIRALGEHFVATQRVTVVR